MPAFSANNAFIVRVPPEAAGSLGENPACELTVDDGEPVRVSLVQDCEGHYVSCLVVPVSELDENADLGLEASVDAVKLKLYGGTGWQMVKIDIGTVISGTMKKVATGTITVRHAALFSALVTNEPNGESRANMAVTQAGGTAVQRLGYGVTPLFSPDKQALNDMLARHRVWVHSGHGHHCHGIEIVRQTGGEYSRSSLKASDITAGDLDYDLVFMNTCESTDTKYYPVFPVTPQACGGWDGPHAYTDGHAVLDIGNKLNAKNYIGWDCEVNRQLSVTIPRMLMQELDSTGTGQTRTAHDAVAAVRQKLDRDKPAYHWYAPRLSNDRCTSAIVLDLNKKPF